MLEIIQTRNAPSPIGPYSQAIRANGFVFVSGQIPVDPDTGEVIAGDVAAQAKQVMKNLAAVLDAAGSGLINVVKTTIFLTDLDDFPGVNRIYGEYLGEVRPARATVQVGRLPKGVMLEVEAIALA